MSLRNSDAARAVVFSAGVAVRSPLGDVVFPADPFCELHRWLLESPGLPTANPRASFDDTTRLYAQALGHLGLVDTANGHDPPLSGVELEWLWKPTQSSETVAFVGSPMFIGMASYLTSELGRFARFFPTSGDRPAGEVRLPQAGIVVISAGISSGMNVREVMAAARLQNAAVLPVWIRGGEVVIGPLFDGIAGPCWTCLRIRFASCAESPSGTSLLDDMPGDGAKEPPRVMTMIAAARACAAVYSLSAPSQRERLERGVYVDNVLNGERTYHVVLPSPSCPDCDKGRGPRSLGRAASGSARKRQDGLVDRRVGIVRRFHTRQALAGEPVFPVSVSAELCSVRCREVAHEQIESVGGRGETRAAARRAALAEAVERYSAAMAWLASSRHCAAGGRIFGPSEIGLYNEQQYSRREFPYRRYSENEEHGWLQGQWLDCGGATSAPDFLVCYGVNPYVQSTTNGLAAGRSPDAAGWAAVLELIERDAVLRAWLLKATLAQISGEAGFSWQTQRTLDELRRCGLSTQLNVLGAAGDVPVIMAVAKGDGRDWPAVVVGSAAARTSSDAIERAVLELSTTAVALRRAFRRRGSPETADQITTFFEHGLYYARSDRASAFEFMAQAPRVMACEIQPCGSEDLRELGGRLRGQAVRVALFDVTSRECAAAGYHVVRAVSSNLQPLHCGVGVERVIVPRLRAEVSGPLTFREPHPLA
jgi:ribosomal protein S12 methylthiotransferase accessory factor